MKAWHEYAADAEAALTAAERLTGWPGAQHHIDRAAGPRRPREPRAHHPEPGDPTMTTPTSPVQQSGDAWLAGAWMQTYNGRAFYPTAPRATDVDPIDIAHALGMICRYGGHSRWFYSVAEHCVLMSYAVPPEDAVAALLHDATEAYVGDMIRPLKKQMPGYQLAEAKVWTVIAERFHLGTDLEYGPLPGSVTEADNRILLDERAALMSVSPHPWDVEDLAPLGVKIECWDPHTASLRYLSRLDELKVV